MVNLLVKYKTKQYFVKSVTFIVNIEIFTDLVSKVPSDPKVTLIVYYTDRWFKSTHLHFLLKRITL